MEAALANAIETVSLASLKPANRNARTHSKKQINQIAASMKRFGFTNPILIDGDNIIVAGHGRYAAANALGLKEAPWIRIGSMTPAEKRAYAIADNAIAAKSGWDKELLALELSGLIDLGFDMELTGFEMPEIDQILVDVAEESPKAPAREDLAPAPRDGAPTSRPGDLWLLGRHRLMCGDAKDWSAMALLMGSERAHMVFTDPPYNLKIEGVVSGRGKAKHGDFVEASGELTPVEFTAFLAQALWSMAPACKDGAILFVCMDRRHIGELLAAGREAALELKNMCVWVKTNGGQGAFYRSKHELVTVWKHGKAEHTNTFGLGEGGRSRTNVWQYAGVNAFKVERSEELAMHPTAKPVAMVADAIRDVTHRNAIVLDFGGSVTTLIAAQKTGRHARLMELDPAYCDTIIRRWEAFKGKNAVLASSGNVLNL